MSSPPHMPGLPPSPLPASPLTTTHTQKQPPHPLFLLLCCVSVCCCALVLPLYWVSAEWLPEPVLTPIPPPPDATQTEVVRLGDVRLINAVLPNWKAAPLVHRDASPAATAILPTDIAPHCLSPQGWEHPNCVSSDAWVTTPACHVRVGEQIWGLLDGAVESGSHNLTLLLSYDGGQLWDQRATIPKPHYTARCVSLSASSIVTPMHLVVEQGDCADCGAAPGLYTFTSDDLGRTWHLVSSP